MYDHNNAPNRWDSWEQDTYRTGRTRPPKRHRSVVAILLIIVILLCGVVSILGCLNIRLFRQLSDKQGPDISFALSGTEDTTDPASIDSSVPANKDYDDIEIAINNSPAGVENIPQEGGLSLQQIYNKAISSVVSISCTSSNGASSGTGVVLTKNGYIVTNHHVVENAEEIFVTFYDDTRLQAVLVGADAVSDLAVLSVSADNLIPAELGDSNALRVGDIVAAIGDPLGVQLRGTMTDGIVSAINRDITVGGRTMTLIQTNAALNSGNSGGPLLNCYGQVIGINTMKIGDNMSTAGVEGLGFAIPSATVKEVVDQLIQQGYVSGRPSLGFQYEKLSVFYQMYYRLPEGFYITAVAEGSHAENAGIQNGDILLALDGVRVTDMDTVNTILYGHKTGDSISAVLYRKGRQYSVTLVLGEART